MLTKLLIFLGWRSPCCSAKVFFWGDRVYCDKCNKRFK